MRADRVTLGLLVTLGLVLVLAAWDASRRRSERDRAAPHVARVAAAMPSPDLALGGSSRHVRFLSLAEPGAFSADDVGGRDGEPTTLVVAPPRGVR